jgi:uncharacterized protein with PIN domain/sulfur carrier protein ThiS
MTTARVRLYAELNEYLPRDRRYLETEKPLADGTTVADLLQEAGVPPGEVDLVLVNGVSVSLDAPVNDGSLVSVYPVFESFDISLEQRIRPIPLRVPRFVLDVHLGRLATLLRMVGFDALYRNDFRDDELLRIASAEKRALLSKDRPLLATPGLERGYHVRADKPVEQLAEVIDRFDLRRLIAPFSRCLLCNVLLKPVAPATVADQVPPRVREAKSVFSRCDGCGRIYWEGTHWERMRALIDRILSRESGPRPSGGPLVDFE